MSNSWADVGELLLQYVLQKKQLYQLLTLLNVSYSVIMNDIITSLHFPITRKDRWGTIDDFLTSSLHVSLFSTGLWESANSIPVHSLILSSHLFFCLPLRLPLLNLLKCNIFQNSSPKSPADFVRLNPLLKTLSTDLLRHVSSFVEICYS